MVAKIIEMDSPAKIDSLKTELKVLEVFESEHHNLVAFKYPLVVDYETTKIVLQEELLYHHGVL